jgi:hypothetical protein
MYAESPIQSQSRTVNGEVAVRIVFRSSFVRPVYVQKAGWETDSSALPNRERQQVDRPWSKA